MKLYGVGMIGFGFIGKVHAHAHRALPLFYDPAPCRTVLKGVCTTSEASGTKAQNLAGFDFHVTDFRDLLARDDIDIVHICTPNNVHFEQVRDALRAGKHVYCDKPLALNVAEAEELADLASTSGSVGQMTFNYRFVPALMRAVQLIDEGFLGDLFSFRAAYLHAGYIDPRRPFSWRTDFSRSGGGAIMDLGAHIIDLLQLLSRRAALGRAGQIAEVSANLQTVIHERIDPRTGAARQVDVDDVALVNCRLAGGAAGSIEASRLATGVQDELRLEMHGSRGALRFNLMEPDWLDAYDAKVPEAPLGGDRGYRRIESVMRFPKPYSLGATKNTVGWLNFHIQSLFDFVDNVARHDRGDHGNPDSPTFEDGAAVQRIVAACQESSARNGAWVRPEACSNVRSSGQSVQNRLQ